MISRKALAGFLVCVSVACFPFFGTQATEAEPQSAGELLEIRLEGEGVNHPVRLELALPTQGMASKVVGPLSQSIANALRQCVGLAALVSQAQDALEIDILFENGRLSKAWSKHLDQ